MRTHPPERLETSESDPERLRFAGGWDLVGIEGEIDREHARRIAASWNACREIPVEALEAGVIADLIASTKALAAILAGQVADLQFCRERAESIISKLSI